MERVTSQKYRDACDQCHTRKIRCVSNQRGACHGCRNNARRCIFSPRDEMGRPRKTPGLKTGASRKLEENPQTHLKGFVARPEIPQSAGSSSLDSTNSGNSKSTEASSADENDALFCRKQNQDLVQQHNSNRLFCAQRDCGNEIDLQLVNESQLCPAEMNLDFDFSRKPCKSPASSIDGCGGGVTVSTPPRIKRVTVQTDMSNASHTLAFDDRFEPVSTLEMRLDKYLRPYQLLSGLMKVELAESANPQALYQAISDILNFLEESFISHPQGRDLSDNHEQRTCFLLVTVLPVLFEVSKSLRSKIVNRAEARQSTSAVQELIEASRATANLQPQRSDQDYQNLKHDSARKEREEYFSSAKPSITAMYQDFEELVDMGTQLMMIDHQLAQLSEVMDRLDLDELTKYFLRGAQQQRQDLDNLRQSLVETRQCLTGICTIRAAC